MILRKTTFIQATCHKLEKSRADFFHDHPNAILFNLVHLCSSMLLSFLLLDFIYVVRQF